MNINQLEEYFNSIELPDKIQLNSCTFVNDVRKMVDSNVLYLRNNPGNKTFMPYYHQLLELRELIETNKDRNHE